MRTFQHKVTVNDMGAIVVFALGAFFCLWHRTNMLMVILGFLLIIVTVRAVDRAIHTKYVLTNDGVLKVKIGRIGKTTHIPLTDVKTIEKRPFAFRLGYYALIELMNGSVVSVQPDNVDSFMSALQKRIEKKDNEE
ncbi:PH domain-containing protein [Prevotella scopos JCM 17725]|nr:PH domain-containing protein [Prevotella scopos]ANR72534.1 hypothetical protein AXF22_03390 [Prevotella scopos JCM 17725]QUB45252.1 PH domain-containing protein [Prevotella scopos JCM 17725]